MHVFCFLLSASVFSLVLSALYFLCLIFYYMLACFDSVANSAGGGMHILPFFHLLSHVLSLIDDVHDQRLPTSKVRTHSAVTS